MGWWWQWMDMAVRHAAMEQDRNRLAPAQVVFFVPLWLTLAFRVLPSGPVRFFPRAADRPVNLDANTMTQLSGALHALALIVGFMMFPAASRSAEFDHRLVIAGPRVCLLPAHGDVLLLTAALAARYATVRRSSTETAARTRTPGAPKSCVTAGSARSAREASPPRTPVNAGSRLRVSSVRRKRAGSRNPER